jgi:phage-related protein
LNVLVPVIKVLTVSIAAYTVASNLASIATKVLTIGFRILTAVLNANPFGLIVAGIAAATAAVITCWNKFAGFRAVILTVWDTIKGFGGILKQYVIDRLVGVINGIGSVGLAIGKLFKGDFSGAWQSAKSGVDQIVGYSATKNAGAAMADLARGVRDNFSSHLTDERRKDAAPRVML